MLDLLRARTRRFDVVFVLGLEEGSFPRRASPSPVPRRRRPPGRSTSARARASCGPSRWPRERYLFYAACTRPSRRLYLVREAATDDGAPRLASPFWDETRALFDAADVTPLDAPAAALGADLAARGRADRARAPPGARGPGRHGFRRRRGSSRAANGWERRLQRARSAFRRRTALTSPAVVAALAGADDLQRHRARGVRVVLVDLVRRACDLAALDRRRGGREAARLDRPHDAPPLLRRACRKRSARERVEAARLEDTLRFLRRCLDEALDGRAPGAHRPRAPRAGRPALARPRALRPRRGRGGGRRSSRGGSRSPSGPSALPPSCSAGSTSAASRSPGRSTGSTSTRSARAGSSGTTSRARRRSRRRRSTPSSSLQIPLYMLVLRDLVGIEPLGGLYRALAGEARRARAPASRRRRTTGSRASSATTTATRTSSGRRSTARPSMRAASWSGSAAGDVRHDPLGDAGCPSWCDLAPMCRVKRQ